MRRRRCPLTRWPRLDTDTPREMADAWRRGAGPAHLPDYRIVRGRPRSVPGRPPERRSPVRARPGRGGVALTEGTPMARFGSASGLNRVAMPEQFFAGGQAPPGLPHMPRHTPHTDCIAPRPLAPALRAAIPARPPLASGDALAAFRLRDPDLTPSTSKEGEVRITPTPLRTM